MSGIVPAGAQVLVTGSKMSHALRFAPDDTYSPPHSMKRPSRSTNDGSNSRPSGWLPTFTNVPLLYEPFEAGTNVVHAVPVSAEPHSTRPSVSNAMVPGCEPK